MATLSVVIPVFGAATLKRAVASVLEQTYRPVDIVVCDDGSPDDPAEVLDEFVDAVTLVRQPNLGLGEARDHAVRKATGEWIVLLDADDEWLPTRLEEMNRCIEGRRSGISIVTTDAILRSPLGDRGCWYDGRAFPSPEDQRRAILRENFVFGSAAVQRSALRAVGGFRAARSEYGAWVRLILSGSRAELIRSPLAIYYESSTQMSRDRIGSYLGVIGTLRGALEQDLTRDERRTALKQIANCRDHIAVAHAVKALSGGSPRANILALHAALVGRHLPALARARLLLGALSPKAYRLFGRFTRAECQR